MNNERCIHCSFFGNTLRRWLVGRCLTWTVLLTCTYAAAQTSPAGTQAALQPTPADPARTITAEQIKKRQEQAEADATLDEATKQNIATLYGQALKALERVDAAAAQAKAFRADAENTQARREQAQQRLEDLRSAEPVVPSGLSLPELEQELAKASSRLAELKQKQAAAEAEPATRADRRREVRNLLFSIPEQIEELDRQLDAAPPGDEPPLVTTARQSELLARRMALEAEIPALENELAKYDAEDAVDLLRLVRDANIQEVAVAERYFLLLDDHVKELRDQAAREAVQKAEEEGFRTLPLLKDFAEENKELADQTQKLTQLTRETDEKLLDVTADLEDVQNRFLQARERVQSIGLTRSVGAQLRKLKASLPNVGRRRQAIRDRQQTIEDVRFQLFELDDERTRLAQPDEVVQEILDAAPPQTSNAERERLRRAARSIVERKREYLDGLIRIQNVYFDSLTTLDTAEQKLVDLTDEYVGYINERVLWIRSGKRLSEDFSLSATNLWIITPERWADVGERLWSDVQQYPVLWIAVVGLFAALVIQKRRTRRTIAEIGQLASKPGCTQFRPTLRAAWLTFLLVAPWTVLCWYVAWRLRVDASPFSAAVAAGLSVQASIYAVLESLRQICRRMGLAQAHFQWPLAAIHTLRANLLGLSVVALPLAFLTTVLYTSDPEQGTGVLERLGIIALCVVVSVALARIIRPQGGLLRDYLALRREGWIDRLQYVWYWSCVAAPLTLAALAYFGYVYTVQQLAMRLFYTASLTLLLVVARAMLLRLLLVHRRKLSIRQARQRRAAALEAQAAEHDAGARSLSQALIPVEEVTDLAQSSVQTRRIVTTLTVAGILIGLWGIWDDVVPALKFVDNWEVWTTVDKVSQDVAEAGSEPQLVPREVLRIVSVGDILLALLVCVITLIAFRNLPGLMEMAVLQRLPLESSVRYAITSLASYAIITVGVVIAAARLGLRWSQIQWLATALTFGLAFGLQEMFANFVAGLIILFERPIRVGDVVTVGDTTGVVSRMRIRATTITNWDRKEFIVPNKEFITGRLLNWTLSDQVNRVQIEVGVAYGTSTETVREILKKIATEHPLVLETPEPIITFESFGDSSLNFSIRVYMSNVDNRLKVIHDLHTSIHNALSEAGITIPFPQRDLHIRTAEPSLAIERRRPAAESELEDFEI